jgi:hypothetical protein
MKRIAIICLVLLAVGLVTATAWIRIAAGGTQRAGTERYPSAVSFASIFVRMTNGFAAARGDRLRISHDECVEASQGKYMCSYVVRRLPAAPRECHLMQAQWQPGAGTPITVTLAGRARRCDTLQAALQSLG